MCFIVDQIIRRFAISIEIVISIFLATFYFSQGQKLPFFLINLVFNEHLTRIQSNSLQMKGNAAHKDPRNYFGTTPCPSILMTRANVKKGRLSPFNTDDKKRVVM